MSKAINYITLMSLILLVSCSRAYKVNCINRPETHLVISVTDTSLRIPFSQFSWTAYKPQTNFTIIDSQIIGSQHDTVLATGLSFDDPYFRKGFDQHDWIFIIYPSGRQFKIRNILRHQESKKFPDYMVEEGDKCINSFSYYVNDTFYSVPQEDAGHAYLTNQYITINY